MIKQVTFAEPTHFQGRNGYFKCTGIEILTYKETNDITLWPITSKGKAGNCCIEIPKNKISELITQLREAVK